MRSFLLSILLSFTFSIAIFSQWTLVGQMNTGSQFDLAQTGRPFMSDDSTQIFFDFPEMRHEVFSLETRSIVHSGSVAASVGIWPEIDLKNERIILLGRADEYDNIVLVSLDDYSQQILHTDTPFSQISIDTISDRIWDAGFDKILERNLNTFEILYTIVPPRNYVATKAFSCPKYNYLYGVYGNYLLVFDLTTFEYLGKVKTGASPIHIEIDQYRNLFFTTETHNKEINIFSDYKSSGSPSLKRKIEFDEVKTVNAGDLAINIEDDYLIYTTPPHDALKYSYLSGKTSLIQVEEPTSVGLDNKSGKIFFGQDRGAGFSVYKPDLSLDWNIPVSEYTLDIEYYGESFVYHLAKAEEIDVTPSVIYKIDLEKESMVTLRLFRISGAEIDVIELGTLNGGYHEIEYQNNS